MNLPSIPQSLSRLAPLIQEFWSPCVRFVLEPPAQLGIGNSKLRGQPDLPRNFSWPQSKIGPLDFLAQIDLAEVPPIDSQGLLPKEGLLTFFYDLEKQPWGYDPDNLDGFRVIYTPPGSAIDRADLPRSQCALKESKMVFTAGLSLPRFGSRAYDRFQELAQMSDDESDKYFEFTQNLQQQGCSHQLFGHSNNVQDDMQLEAQLVTNGLYCGNSTGYQDPRRADLEREADQWLLLLQVDSDDRANLLWGDTGMLYFWIRQEDLAAQRFDKVWMTMQCC